jgi:hypothetical protein
MLLDKAKRGIVTRKLAIGEFNLRHNAATTCGKTTVYYVTSTLGYLRYKRPTFNRTAHDDDSMVRPTGIRWILCFEIKPLLAVSEMLESNGISVEGGSNAASNTARWLTDCANVLHRGCEIYSLIEHWAKG